MEFASNWFPLIGAAKSSIVLGPWHMDNNRPINTGAEHLQMDKILNDAACGINYNKSHP